MQEPPAPPADSSGNSPESAPAAAYRAFTALGRGGRDDRLSFRLILSLLGRSARYLRPVWKHLAGLIIATLVLLALVAIPAINLINLFWNGILTGQPISELQAAMVWGEPSRYVEVEALDAESRKALLRRLVITGGALALFFAPLFLGLAYWRVWILQRINHSLRLDMMDRLQSLSLRFHSEQRVGDSIYRMLQDSSMVTQLIDVLFLKPLSILSQYLFSVGVIALWDPRLSLILLLAWPPLVLLGHRFAKPLRGGFRNAREANSALTSRIQETLAGIKIIKAYGVEAAERVRFEAASSEAFAQAYAARVRFVRFKLLTFYAVGMALVAGVGVATDLTATGASLYAEQFMIAMGFAALNSGNWNLGFYNNFKDRFGDGTKSAHQALDLWGSVQDVATGLDRVFELLDLEPEVVDAQNAIELPIPTQGIAYRDVSFAYERGRPILSNVSFDVKLGTSTAVVGPTGSGKSTLVNLLLRLYDPASGCIEIDGRDLRDFKIQSLRDQISIALQENVLFGASIRENIRYAVPTASESEVREAARVACAADFIEALPEGYDTMLGERGAKLSTGQRQRISMARALLKNAPVLILDEPTASLDAATELAVLENLKRWGKGRVIFLITHRLSTIRQADHVAVIRDGELAEFGGHSELMAREGGEYRRLVEAEESPLTARPKDSA